MESASFTSLRNRPFLSRDKKVRLRIVAFRTQDELSNESIQQVLKLGRIMGAINNEALVLKTKNTLDMRVMLQKGYEWEAGLMRDFGGNFPVFPRMNFFQILWRVNRFWKCGCKDLNSG